MGKATTVYVLEGSLDRVAEADRLYVCTDEPADFAGIAALTLAEETLTPGDGNGDFTHGAGDVSGRKTAVAQKADLAIDASGEADHIVLADQANSRLLEVTTCPPTALTMGGTVTVAPWDVEFEDPV